MPRKRRRKQADARDARHDARQRADAEEHASREKQESQPASVPPRRRRDNEKLEIGGFDVPFFMIIIMLTFIGLVMLFSASYASAYYKFSTPFYFIERQAIFALLGFTIMMGIMMLPYQVYHRAAVPALVVSFVLLVAVLFIGQTRNNATRWMGVGETLTFQPSEIAKISVIIAFSSFSVRFGRERMRTIRYGIVPFMLIIGAMAGLLMKEPHLSATIIIAITGIVIIFIAGTRVSYLSALGIIGAAALFWVVFDMGYGLDRVTIWLDPTSDPKGDGYQILQSLYAIGSGGLWGLGLGQSRQKHLYLPEPWNDFIFSIVCEELGFVGAVLIILLFAAFIIRGYYIALRSRDNFGTLLVAGIMTQIALQVIFNIGVVTGFMPVTGASLPFFSSGGTSMVILFGELGIVMAVSKQIPAAKRGRL